IWHACGGHAVGYKNGFICSLCFEPEANHLRGNVDAIADQLREQTVVVEHDGNDAGRAMVERAHGIERMRCTARSCVDCGERLLRCGVGVADADLYAASCGMFDKGERAGNLRSDGDEANMSASSLLEAVEESDIRRKNVGRRVNALLG